MRVDIEPIGLHSGESYDAQKDLTPIMAAPLQRARSLQLSRVSMQTRCAMTSPGLEEQHGYHVCMPTLLGCGERAR